MTSEEIAMSKAQ